MYRVPLAGDERPSPRASRPPAPARAPEQFNIFTIVLNGMPFITQHLARFSSLGMPFHWSICHGIADPVADTGWCKPLDGVEDDGTLAYIQDLARDYPQQITVTHAAHWPGKTVMCNTALQAFSKPGVLLEVDVDEMWRVQQLETMWRLFEAFPRYDHAFFFCRYFVGEKRILAIPDFYANHTAWEWCRAWRWEPGRKFLRHEPPIMEGQRRINAMPHALTACSGLIFDHFSWTHEPTVVFKEKYYNYPGAVDGWRRLQATKGPADLSKFFPWVKEPGTMTYEIP